MLMVSMALVVGLGVVVASAALTAPATFEATDTQVGNEVHLSWAAATGGTAPSYVVQYKLASANDSTYATATTTTTTTATFTDAALANGSSYLFRVEAVEGSEVTTWAVSNPVTPSDATAPSVSLTLDPAAPNAAGWFSVVPTYTIVAVDRSAITTYAAQVDATAAPAAVKDGGPVAAGADGALSEGSHTLYFRATDAASNTSAWASQAFKVDTTKPVVTATGVGGYVSDSPTKTLPSVKLAAADTDGSGIAKIEYIVVAHGAEPAVGATWTTVAAAEATVEATAGRLDLIARTVDVAGNVSDAVTFTTWSDAVAPVTTAVTTPDTADGANGTWFTYPTIALDATDDVEAPIVTSFVWDGGPVTTGVDTAVPSVPGTHTLEFFSTDAAGNVEATKSATFVVDPGQPVSIGAFTPENPDGWDGWYASQPAFTLSASAADEATIATIYYSLTSATGPWTAYENTVTVSAEGTHTIYHYAVDVNGRPGPVSSDAYKLDTVAPTLGTISPLFTSSHNPTLTVTVTDATSGAYDARFMLVNELRFKVASFGSGDFDPETGVLTYKPFWPLVEGQNAVMMQAIDAAGNETDFEFAYVTVDTLAPVTISDAVAAYTAKATITLWPSDAGAGVAKTYYRLDGGAVVEGRKVVTSVLGDHTLSFWSEDVLGNVESAKTVAFNVSVPTKLGIKASRATVYRGHSTVTFSGTISPNVPNGTPVLVQIRKVGSSTWKTLSTRKTYSSHHWSYSYKVPKSLSRGSYYVVVKYMGSASYRPSISSKLKIYVR